MQRTLRSNVRNSKRNRTTAGGKHILSNRTTTDTTKRNHPLERMSGTATNTQQPILMRSYRSHIPTTRNNTERRTRTTQTSNSTLTHIRHRRTRLRNLGRRTLHLIPPVTNIPQSTKITALRTNNRSIQKLNITCRKLRTAKCDGTNHMQILRNRLAAKETRVRMHHSDKQIRNDNTVRVRRSSTTSS